MQALKRNPLPHSPLLWLMLLAALWACLGAQTLSLKTASGQIYGLKSASWESTPLQAAPRLGLRASELESVSAPPVGANGGTVGKGAAGSVDDVAPVTSGGTANTANGNALGDSLASQMPKPTNVSDPQLSGMMDDLYRDGAKIGSGSTADAVRYENATGQPVGGVFHTKKAWDYAAGLQRWLNNNPNAAASDIAAAQNVKRDLLNALKGK